MAGRRALRSAAGILIFLLILPCTLALSVSAGDTTNLITYTFPSFNNSLYANGLLSVVGDATVSPNGALQITPDTINNADLLQNKAGRAFLPRPFRLWQYSSLNSSATYVASFFTAFSVNIFHVLPSRGEGIAFLIAPDNSAIPPGSSGGFLALSNATTDGNATNRFVAVELDTVKQPYDIDDNHIGLDINGVHSYAAASLTPLNITIAPVNGTNHTVWVDYDGAGRRIQVFMGPKGHPKPAAPVLNETLDLSKVIPQDAYIGFAASTGQTYELHCVLDWELAVENLEPGSPAGLTGWKLGVAVGAPLAAAAVAAAVVAYLCVVRKRRVLDGDEAMGSSAIAGSLNVLSLPGMPREFKYKELMKATGNFGERNRLGQGGYGVVYRGTVMQEDGKTKEVAVKQFTRDNTRKGIQDFIDELSIINRLRHRNLVSLVGWCHQNGVLLLVYDYMPNGSLDQHLFGHGEGKPYLPWDIRYNILVGVASALRYLHREYDQLVVHRDIKPSNIMLDSEFNARLGDFGLARAVESDMTSYAERSGVPGTPGYIALECFHTGKATCESDIYAFGAVVLEVVCARRLHGSNAMRNELVDWVWKLHGDGHLLDAVDPMLNGEYEEKEAQRLLLLGLACCHPNPEERPKILSIVQILAKSAEPPTVPEAQPPFMWPAPQTDMSAYRSALEMGMEPSSTALTTSSLYASTSWTSYSPLSRDRDVAGV